MPAEFKRITGICLSLLLTSAALLRAYAPPSTPAPHPFQYNTDSFAFANETVWNYVNGSVQAGPGNAALKREYTRRCFVVTRAAVQFWKFARFDPHAPPLSVNQLADRIREVTARSVWLPALPPDQRIVFPGCASLRALSAANPGLFQANIGLGWPVYFRAGNAPIAVPLSPATEADLNDEIFRDLGMNYPTVVWLYRFPSLAINHVVVVISGRKDGAHYHYLVYDPNYTDGPKKLEYNARTETFSYQPTFYFKGGNVDARAIYRGVFQ
jgi:hypothetical protein